MAGFTIDKLYFGNPPASPQTITLQYKLWSDPDTSYVTIATVSVNPDGTIVSSPLPTVTGLSPALYYIRSYNACSSPIDYFLTSVYAQ